MKFLLDENLSPVHAGTLRALGHDAVSVVELKLSGAHDSVVRDAAVSHERILVTLDADFANVLMFPPAETPGVVRFRIHSGDRGSHRRRSSVGNSPLGRDDPDRQTCCGR